MQGFGHPAGAGLGLGADHSAAGDAVLGTQPQPGGEVAPARPFGHIRAGLADHLERRVRVHAVGPGQVHPGHPVEVTLDVEARRVPLMALFTIGRRRLAVTAVLKSPELN